MSWHTDRKLCYIHRNTHCLENRLCIATYPDFAPMHNFTFFIIIDGNVNVFGFCLGILDNRTFPNNESMALISISHSNILCNIKTSSQEGITWPPFLHMFPVWKLLYFDFNLKSIPVNSINNTLALAQRTVWRQIEQQVIFYHGCLFYLVHFRYASLGLAKIIHLCVIL